MIPAVSEYRQIVLRFPVRVPDVVIVFVMNEVFDVVIAAGRAHANGIEQTEAAVQFLADEERIVDGIMADALIIETREINARRAEEQDIGHG